MADLFGIGSFLGGVASMAGQLGSTSMMINADKKADERSYKYNKALMQYQNSLQTANWLRETAYNTPAQQMQRFAAAGLNPALMYNQSNTASDIGSVSIPNFKARSAGDRIDPNMFGNVINSAIQNFLALSNGYQDIELKKAQENNLNAQTKKAQSDADLNIAKKAYQEAETMLSKAKHKGILADSDIKEMEKNVWQDRWELTKKQMLSQDALVNARITEINQNLENWKKDFNFRSEQAQQQQTNWQHQFDYQKSVDAIKLSRDKFIKEHFYDNGYDYSSGQFGDLFNQFRLGIQDIANAIRGILPNW